jgi:hypothetical protein
MQTIATRLRGNLSRKCVAFAVGGTDLRLLRMVRRLAGGQTTTVLAAGGGFCRAGQTGTTFRPAPLFRKAAGYAPSSGFSLPSLTQS